MRLLRLTARHQRTMVTSWLVLLIALVSGTPSAYQSTYPTAAARRAATELAQHNPATTLLYGRLPAPGTPAQMFSWEIGAFVTILAALMGVLLAVSMTRASEDEGTIEVIRSAGVAPGGPLGAAVALLVLVALLLDAACVAALGLYVGRVDALTWTGAIGFGTVVAMTFLLVGVLTLVLAQLAPTAGGARLLGLGALGVSFAVRAYADTAHIGWLEWASPLALRQTVRPFTDNRGWVPGVYALGCLALVWLAGRLDGWRDYGVGLIRPRRASNARLRTRSCLGLTARLTRRSTLTWTAAVASFGALFSAMGQGVVRMSGAGQLDGGFLGSQLAGNDPVASYFSYTGTVLGIIVSVFAVLAILRTNRAERDSLTDHVLATGVRRWVPLGSQILVTAAGALLVLVAAGALSAWIAPRAVDGSHVAARAFTYTLGQWPATMAMAGTAALVVATLPRGSWLAWPPLVMSSGMALLGPLLRIPQHARDLSVFQHVPDIAGGNPDGRALVTLLSVGVATSLLALVTIRRRDVTTG